jgi:HemY protein
MRNELWGKAREYFDTSIEISPTVEANGELARLLKFLGEEKLADEHQDKFVRGVGAELPNLSMPKALDKA